MSPDDEQLYAVAAICARLDGLPLAIELAAARTRVLSPQRMLQRLDANLPVLAHGGADLPERQRTIEATIAWSYDLLKPAEQRVLARLSVFVAGCTLDAAEAICADTDVEVLDIIESLVDQSLLVARREAETDETRFSMLETIRAFALERLRAAGELDTAQSAMTEHFRALARRGEWEVYGFEHVTWLHRLTHDLGNFRAVMRWAQAKGHGKVCVALAGTVWKVLDNLGAWSEALEWLRVALEAPDASQDQRVGILARICITIGWQRRADAASVYAERHELARTLNRGKDPRVRGLAHLGLGLLAGADGELEAFRAHSLSAAEEIRELSAVLFMTAMNNAAGAAMELGDLDQALQEVTLAMDVFCV